MSLRVIGGRRVRYQFCQAVHDLPPNETTQSQSLSWGPEPLPGETRHLILGLAFSTASGVAPSAVSAGGDAAATVIEQAPPGVFTVGQGLYIVKKQLGISGLVEFSVSSDDIDGGMIAVWAAYNLQSPTAFDTSQSVSSGAGVSDLSLNTKLGGAVFAVASMSNTGSRSVDWVGVTEDSANETVDDQQWAASQFDLSAETPRTVQASWLVTGNPFTISAVAASFR